MSIRRGVFENDDGIGMEDISSFRSKTNLSMDEFNSYDYNLNFRDPAWLSF